MLQSVRRCSLSRGLDPNADTAIICTAVSCSIGPASVMIWRKRGEYLRMHSMAASRQRKVKTLLHALHRIQSRYSFIDKIYCNFSQYHYIAFTSNIR